MFSKAEENVRSYSPKIITQNGTKKPQIKKDSAYELKIVEKKKNDEKYKSGRKNNGEVSLDDKQKTKQLLKNINLEKLFRFVSPNDTKIRIAPQTAVAGVRNERFI